MNLVDEIKNQQAALKLEETRAAEGAERIGNLKRSIKALTGALNATEKKALEGPEPAENAEAAAPTKEAVK